MLRRVGKCGCAWCVKAVLYLVANQLRTLPENMRQPLADEAVRAAAEPVSTEAAA